MARHLLLVAVAAPLLALALARHAPGLAAAVAARCPPIAASAVELVAVWGWHAPALHAAARHGGPMLVLEQATFLLAGLLLWITAYARRLQGILALLVTAMHMTLLGVLLALSPRLLFDHHPAGASLAPLADQELGGVLMLVVGGLAYLAGGLGLLAGLLESGTPQGAAREGER
jgi:putative membrane protein